MNRKPPEVRLDGYLDGKPLIAYGQNKSSTLEQVRQHLRKQPTFALLAALGRASWILDGSPGHIPLLHGVPVSMHAVATLAVLAIEYSNDYRTPSRRLDEDYLAKLFDLFLRLADPLSGTSDSSMATEFMVRAGEHQFTYQSEMRHQIPRMRLLLVELWPQVAQATAQVPSPLEDFESISGLHIDAAFTIGLLFMGAGRRGILEPLLEREDSTTPEALDYTTSISNRRAFLKWASGDYDTVRAAAASATPLSENYTPYRHNPLRRLPLVKPSARIAGTSDDAVLVPVARLVFERATLGVFHDLANCYNGGGSSNAFRNAFGHVFQAYVGLLLRESLAKSQVLSEWKYGPTHADTPDWIVLEGRRAVILEAKHSSLLLATKQWGKVEDLRADLRKSLGKALSQLSNFRDAVAARVAGLDMLHDLDLELVIVTFDRLHYANSIVRDELESLSGELKMVNIPHVHIVPIEAFEYLLGACEASSLFDLLSEKRRDPGTDRMDVKDWLAYRREDGALPSNTFLSRKYDEFFLSLGIAEHTVARSCTVNR